MLLLCYQRTEGTGNGNSDEISVVVFTGRNDEFECKTPILTF